jgi:hypothetical protein
MKDPAIVLCKIINFKGTSKLFIEQLENDKLLKPLFECEYYSE